MINKTIITVPKGIRFLSEWEDFSLPEEPTIIDKQITGCGFTEYCIRCNIPTILAVPRKCLAENKYNQHSLDIFYAENKLLQDLWVDKELGKRSKKHEKKKDLKRLSENVISLQQSVKNAYYKFIKDGKCPKFIVVYDSYRHVKEALESIGAFHLFYTIIDEFQSIFQDSGFKPDTEIEFMYHLQGIKKLCYVSATPYFEDYIDDVPQLASLPFWKLDWYDLDHSRIEIPNIQATPYTKSLVTIGKEIVEEYLREDFIFDTIISSDGLISKVYSKEAVIYYNSVKNICDIVKKCNLTLDQVNIICADTSENREKIRTTFGLKKNEHPKDGIGTVPLKGEKNKMFTFCTKTAYLGSDFYSKCARTFILSDSSIECMAVDITNDLSQILGRQRDDSNPWKNSAEIYFRPGTGAKEITQEQFDSMVKEKIRKTETFLRAYESAPEEDKQVLAEGYLEITKNNNYKDNYLAVNTHNGKTLVPCLNNLVIINEKRSYDIMQKDYFSRFTVFSTINELVGNSSVSDDGEAICNILDKFNHYYNTFPEKMKFIIDVITEFPEIKLRLLKVIPKRYKNYITILGIEKILGYSCRGAECEREYSKFLINKECDSDILTNLVLNEFKEGNKYTKSYIKEILGKVYIMAGLKKTAKSLDIEEWYEIKPCKITNPETKKRDMGFELIKKK